MVCWAAMDKPTLGEDALPISSPSHPPGFSSNHGLSQRAKAANSQLMPHKENSDTQHESQSDGEDEQAQQIL